MDAVCMHKSVEDELSLVTSVLNMVLRWGLFDFRLQGEVARVRSCEGKNAKLRRQGSENAKICDSEARSSEGESARVRAKAKDRYIVSLLRFNKVSSIYCETGARRPLRLTLFSKEEKPRVSL